MLIFTSLKELSKLHLDDPARDLVQELLLRLINIDNYNWRFHGFIAYVEQYDAERLITELSTPMRLIDIPLFEYVEYRNNHYIAVYLQSDLVSYGFIISDEEWLPKKLREILNSQLET